jgi:CRISPR type III-B/RAMP module RAMP protein Cmr1
MSMEKRLFELIYSCLKENRGKLQLPVRQRAKVEGWLKVELLYSIWQELLHGNHNSEIEIERPYPKNKKLRCDIFFTTPRKRNVYLELKIVNTSYNCNYNRIPKKTKAIADNVNSVIEAANRLRKFTKRGDQRIVAFVVYPLCKEKLSKWEKHESEINKKIGEFFDPKELIVFTNDKRVFMRLYLYQVFIKTQKY